MAKIIDTRLNECPLPVHIQSDCDYYYTLENIFNNYYKHIILRKIHDKLLLQIFKL